MKYESDLHLFSSKLSKLLINKGMVDKKGNPDKVALYNALYPHDKISDKLLKQDRQQVTDKTRSISNWLNGKNFPKTITDVISLCNVLDCDLDYFFSTMEAPTHDIEFISSQLNISNDAVIYLESATEYEQLILDTLLSKGYFWDICYAIYSYMQTYYKEIRIQDKDTGNSQLQDGEKMEFAEYRATKHFSDVLVNKIANDKDVQEYNKHEHDLETLQNISSKAKQTWEQTSIKIQDLYEEFKASGKTGYRDFIEYIRIKGGEQDETT